MSTTKATRKAAKPKKAIQDRQKATSTGAAKVSRPPKTKSLSALGAAARVLGEFDKPMSTRELIDQMASKGYWTSPGGKTPAATLYSAILREITTKGTRSQFVKAAPGKFSLNT